jgi:hypothetical protein
MLSFLTKMQKNGISFFEKCRPTKDGSIKDAPCTVQSSITTNVPRRESGTFRTAVKGPDHYPSWEVVAEMLYE